MFIENMFISVIPVSKCFLIFLMTVMIAGCGTGSKVITDANNSVIDSRNIVISEEFGIDADLSAKFYQAVEHIRTRKFALAIELLLVVTSKTDKHSAPYINLGIAYSELGKMEEAEAILQQAIKINPMHPVTNNELGLVYRKTGRFSEAKKTYENVIRLYPQFLPARKNLAILCDLFMGDLDCAIEHYEAYLKIIPNDKNVKIWLTDLKRRAG